MTRFEMLIGAIIVCLITLVAGVQMGIHHGRDLAQQEITNK